MCLCSFYSLHVCSADLYVFSCIVNALLCMLYVLVCCMIVHVFCIQLSGQIRATSRKNEDGRDFLPPRQPIILKRTAYYAYSIKKNYEKMKKGINGLQMAPFDDLIRPKC